MKINVTPYLVINIHEIRNWENKSIKDIYMELEYLRIRVKKATDYYWDNNHFFINSRRGKLGLSIQPHYSKSGVVEESYISLWNAKTDTAMPTIKGPVISHTDIGVLEGYLENIDKDLVQCCECEMWFDEENMEHYSYAGIVCHGCYDVNKHLPPEAD